MVVEVFSRSPLNFARHLRGQNAITLRAGARCVIDLFFLLLHVRFAFLMRRRGQVAGVERIRAIQSSVIARRASRGRSIDNDFGLARIGIHFLFPHGYIPAPTHIQPPPGGFDGGKSRDGQRGGEFGCAEGKLERARPKRRGKANDLAGENGSFRARDEIWIVCYNTCVSRSPHPFPLLLLRRRPSEASERENASRSGKEIWVALALIARG